MCVAAVNTLDPTPARRPRRRFARSDRGAARQHQLGQGHHRLVTACALREAVLSGLDTTVVECSDKYGDLARVAHGKRRDC